MPLQKTTKQKTNAPPLGGAVAFAFENKAVSICCQNLLSKILDQLPLQYCLKGIAALPLPSFSNRSEGEARTGSTRFRESKRVITIIPIEIIEVYSQQLYNLTTMLYD